MTFYPDFLPLNHRETAEGWAALLTLRHKAPTRQIAGGLKVINIKSVLNDTFDEGFGAVFVYVSSTDRSVRATTEGTISALIDELRLVSFAFEFRLDVFEDNGDDDGGDGCGNCFANEAENEAHLFQDMEHMVNRIGDDDDMSS